MQADINRLTYTELEEIQIAAKETIERRKAAPPGAEILREEAGLKRLTDEQLQYLETTADKNLTDRRNAAVEQRRRR